MAQGKHLGRLEGRIFPHNSRSVGTVFRCASIEVTVKDPHFHDLRYESTSHLFEAGFGRQFAELQVRNFVVNG